MKTQISRDAFRPERRESAVYQQQGRMLTDADWNLLADIVKQRLDDALADVVGGGAPREGGLEVKDAAGLLEGSRLYAGGVPARVVRARPAEPFAYGNQADFPSPPALPAKSFILYADVWERTVVSLEDAAAWAADHLRDPALHGADTTTRTQTMAQVKWCPRTEDPENPVENPPLGDARLTVTLRAGTAGADPCDPCASEVAVARRVGNYLFRLEVHDVVVPVAGEIVVTFKWSSENGAEQHRVGAEPADFKVGDFVYELYNDATEKHLGVHLAPGFTPARSKLEESFPGSPPPGFDRVRRWDGYAELKWAADGAWSLVRGKEREIRLEIARTTNPGGVRLTSDHLVFHLKAVDLDLFVGQGPDARRFVAGDYWLTPVREDAHKSGDRVLADAPPVGIVHHPMLLARVDAGGNLESPDPDRPQRLEFPPLTDLVLPASKVTFAKPCDTSLYKGVPPASIKTVADALRLLCDIKAEHIGYKAKDASGCSGLGITTVKDALDALCDRPAGGGGCRVTVGQGGRFPTIKDAIEDLLRVPRPVFDICLCLLPGDHRVTSTLEVKAEGRAIYLSVCGCGMGSRLILEPASEFRLEGFRSVRIADLSWRIERTARFSAKECGEIVLERLVVTGPARTTPTADGLGALVLEAHTSLRVATSRFRFLDNQSLDLLANIFTSRIGLPRVGDLLSPPFDDDSFPAQRTLVAGEVAALLKDSRQVIVNNINALFPSPPAPVNRRNVMNALVRFRNIMDPGGPTEPRPAPTAEAVAATFTDLREAALELHPSVVLSVGSVAADVTLIDNQILGTVTIYAGPFGGRDIVDRLNVLALAVIQEDNSPDPKLRFVPGGALMVTRNDMSRLTVGDQTLAALRNVAERPSGPNETFPAYHTACIGQNRFSADRFSVLARDVRLTDNRFDLVPDESEPLGWVLADTSVYVGNSQLRTFSGAFLNASAKFKPATISDLNTLSVRTL